MATTTTSTNSSNRPGVPSSPPSFSKRILTPQQEEHEAFKNRLVDDVLGEGAGDKVPMEKVVMLIWQFRDDPSVITFMARFMAKYSGVRHVLDGIEFYLPQLAHMIIHLEVEWDDAILERFALVIAQQSIHFALQLNWILQGALQDYRPENEDGTPNDKYNPLFYTRCLKLLKNVERCVVYGKPRAQELQRLYEKGEITKQEMIILEQADRRFNALQITTKEAEDYFQAEGELDGLLYVSKPRYKSHNENNNDNDNEITNSNRNNNNNNNNNNNHPEPQEFEQRFCVLDRHVLNLYTQGGCSIENKIDRALSLEHAEIHTADTDKYTIRIERPEYDIWIKCNTQEDMNLWKRRLEEEAQTSVLFHTKDTRLRADLTPAQLDRYDLFQNERKFVQALTDLAEDLRFKDRTERKKLAPILMEKLQIPETVYLPLCNSSDIWRRASGTVPNETRVFNTKERCPVIMYFISKRGEISKRGLTTRVDPNIDVAEFLHNYFDVSADNNNGMEKVTEVPSDEEQESERGIKKNSNGSANNHQGGGTAGAQQQRHSEHDSSYSGVWANEDTQTNDDDDDNNNEVSNNEGIEQELEVQEPQTPTAHVRVKGNSKVQRLLRESIVTLPTMLSKRLVPRGKSVVSVMDRQTQMQPMVQIIEGRSEDADNASVGDGTVVSVERSSILVKDRILYGDLDEGDIDLESIDRAKQFVSNGQSWAEKSAKMLEDARIEHEESGVQLEITSCMSKSNDDLRQEVFVMQMIHYYKSVFAQAKLPLWLKTYRILSTGSSTGLLEVLVDATSLDGLKKSSGYPTEGGLRAYFETVYGGPDSPAFKAAQTNFMQSLAAYALVSYLLGLKDRHNGNIMIDTRGHLIFIDFGFALGMAPGHEFSMERAPFKLTKEMVDVMGGVNSDCYKEFERLFVAGFEEARKNSQIALGLVEIMMYKSNYPCFSGWRYGKGKALTKFEKRLMLRIPDQHVKKRALRLIRKSKRNFGTYLYDVFQKATNGYAI